MFFSSSVRHFTYSWTPHILEKVKISKRLYISIGGDGLRCYPYRLPEKFIGNRCTVLSFGLLSFAMFVGMQQEFGIFHSPPKVVDTFQDQKIGNKLP